MTMPFALAAAAVIGVLVLGGALLLAGGGSRQSLAVPTATASPATLPPAWTTAAPMVDARTDLPRSYCPTAACSRSVAAAPAASSRLQRSSTLPLGHGRALERCPKPVTSRRPHSFPPERSLSSAAPTRPARPARSSTCTTQLRTRDKDRRDQAAARPARRRPPRRRKGTRRRRGSDTRRYRRDLRSHHGRVDPHGDHDDVARFAIDNTTRRREGPRDGRL